MSEWSSTFSVSCHTLFLLLKFSKHIWLFVLCHCICSRCYCHQSGRTSHIMCLVTLVTQFQFFFPSSFSTQHYQIPFPGADLLFQGTGNTASCLSLFTPNTSAHWNVFLYLSIKWEYLWIHFVEYKTLWNFIVMLHCNLSCGF